MLRSFCCSAVGKASHDTTNSKSLRITLMMEQLVDVPKIVLEQSFAENSVCLFVNDFSFRIRASVHVYRSFFEAGRRVEVSLVSRSSTGDAFL